MTDVRDSSPRKIGESPVHEIILRFFLFLISRLRVRCGCCTIQVQFGIFREFSWITLLGCSKKQLCVFSRSHAIEIFHGCLRTVQRQNFKGLTLHAEDQRSVHPVERTLFLLSDRSDDRVTRLEEQLSNCTITGDFPFRSRHLALTIQIQEHQALSENRERKHSFRRAEKFIRSLPFFSSISLPF